MKMINLVLIFRYCLDTIYRTSMLLLFLLVLLLLNVTVLSMTKVALSASTLVSLEEQERNTIDRLIARYHNTATASNIGSQYSALMAALHDLPWIDEVSALRSFDLNWTIDIKKSQPVAWWKPLAATVTSDVDRQLYLMDKRGRLFLPTKKYIDLPQLSGPSSQAAKTLRYWRDFKNLLSAVPALDLSALHLDIAGHWHLYTVCNATIHLPAKNPMPMLKRLLRFYPFLPPSKSIDMRYQQGMAVATRQATELTCA